MGYGRSRTIVLIFHIGAGVVALLSGATALFAAKGSRPHRSAGTVFFVAMLIMSGCGAYLAYVKPETVSVIAGILTFYMVATAWMTVRRTEGTIGRFEIGACLAGLATGAGAIFFGMQASASETGALDGFPPEIFYFFGIVGLLAGACDLKVILRRGIVGARRIARHLWRMCFALFVATASFFLGQMQVIPEPLRRIELLVLPVLVVIVLLFFWLIRVRFTRWYSPREDLYARGSGSA